MTVFRALRLVNWQEDNDGTVTCNNLTLINFVIIMIGPTREEKLTKILLLIQVSFNNE